MSVPSARVTTVPALAGGRLPLTLVGRLTGNQIDALGRRIRDAPDPAQLDQGDLTLLQRLLAEHAEALEQVNRQLHRSGLTPHPRLKSADTLVEKLRREPLSLRGIHDLAGTRVARRMTLDMQDTLVRRICAVCPGAGEPIDRRARPNHGYRAVHVVCRVGGRHVEIQVRTLYQDTWDRSWSGWETCSVVRSVELAIGERDGGPIFTGTDGKRLDRHGASRIARRVARRAGVTKPIGPHALRHPFITDALDAGIPLRDVQEAASHSDPRTAMRYDRARVSLDRHATCIVSTYIAGAAR